MIDRHRSRECAVFSLPQGTLVAVTIAAAILLVACSSSSRVVPRQYVKQIEPGITLTDLTLQPKIHEGKVVVLGGVIVMRQEVDNRFWLWIKNRPLDDDYVPHIPVTNEGPEAGHYWVVIEPDKLPPGHHEWARLTVVGKVVGMQTGQQGQGTGEEVVLAALYLKGWGKDWGGYNKERDTSGSVRPPRPPSPLQKNSPGGY